MPRTLLALLLTAGLLTSACAQTAPATDDAASASTTTEADVPSLADVYEDTFLVGAALNPGQFTRQDERGATLVKKHFNTITPGNVMKWENIHPEPGEYDFEMADAYVAFGETNDMFIVGHTLVWHNQTPAWVFEDEDGNPASREMLLERMRDHIHTVVGRYEGRIDGWDVVNEALNDDGTLRETPWLEIIGEDYLAKAFQFAHEADPDAELYYNDYSLNDPEKRDGAVRLVRNLLDQGIAVSGIGMQAHYGLDYPALGEIGAGIEAFAGLGVDVMITELDVAVLPRPDEHWGADITQSAELREELNPYPDAFPDSMQQALARRYADFFGVFRDHRDALTRVTFWGVTDGDSWLNGWPIAGRTSYPLLFDRRYQPKPAFVSVVPRGAAAQPSAPLLNAVFQDHAVLQRAAPIPVWGTARPGAAITVEMAGASVQAEADGEGNWSAELPATPAGGPHALRARSTGGRVQVVSDVLVGDVFLCSGQSNMVLPVRRTINAGAEIRSASNERIRMMTVDLASSAVPLDTLPGVPHWKLTTPETVPDWSAACYYFARDLQPHMDVPLGLITSAWGGSKISAWMRRDALSEIAGYDEPLALLRQYAEDQQAAQQEFGQKWEAWWRGMTGDAAGAEPWQPEAGAQWSRAPDRLGNWKGWDTPDLNGYNGMVWFRVTVDLTAAQAQQAATLSLGGIDEVDQTWINGQVVGNTFGYGTPRTYAVPAEHLQEGENVVVVNVLNTYGAGGMTGDSSARAIITEGGERRSLRDWRYKKADAGAGSPPRAPWESVGGLTTIHNAMIAPMRDYGLKAVLWYQGESDTGEPDQYLRKLRTLKGQWRDQFGADLPVLVVQLANYGEPPSTPTESGWAEVRDAQRRATQSDPRAGLAVTIDVGNKFDIHPRNKQAVGHRLARAARHVIYDDEITPSGPLPDGASRDGNRITVSFEDVDGSLVVHGDAAPIGFELCGSESESCRYAGARIDGTRVHLRAENAGGATRVRYCWADSPICTLYDEAGLPASPFEIDVSGE